MPKKKNAGTPVYKTVAGLLAVFSPFVSASDDLGLDFLASHYMAQLYEVPAETIKVTVLSADVNQARVKTTAASGVVCNMQLVSRPEGIDLPYEWLVDSLECA